MSVRRGIKRAPRAPRVRAKGAHGWGMLRAVRPWPGSLKREDAYRHDRRVRVALRDAPHEAVADDEARRRIDRQQHQNGELCRDHGVGRVERQSASRWNPEVEMQKEGDETRRWRAVGTCRFEKTPCHIARPSHTLLSSTIPPPRFFTHSLSRQHNPSPFLTAPGTDPEKGFSPSAPALVALFASSLVQTCELEVDQPIALATMYPPA